MKKYFLIVTAFFALSCESLFFYPEPILRYHPAITEARPIDAVFASADGTYLSGWYIKARDTYPKAKGTVLYMHGNALNMSSEVLGALWLTDCGYNIFAFDYRGYGVSHGEPDIKGVVEDGRAALKFLVSGEVPDTEKVIIYGQSLGGAVAVLTAATAEERNRIDKIILDSPFASWRRIFRQKAGALVFTWLFQYPISLFIDDEFAPEKFIGTIDKDIKILIIHNKADKVVTFDHAEALLRAGGENVELIAADYPGHVTATAHDNIRKKMLEFMEAD
jgi:fermentation-respiration switch protein FrsA (DUF1100 family)